jgi:hypothetical protein
MLSLLSCWFLLFPLHGVSLRVSFQSWVEILALDLPEHLLLLRFVSGDVDQACSSRFGHGCRSSNELGRLLKVGTIGRSMQNVGT